MKKEERIYNLNTSYVKELFKEPQDAYSFKDSQSRSWI